jgi:hypothetical protein
VRRVLCFCLCIGVFLCSAKPAAAQSFKSAKLLPVSAGVDFVLSADLNGDGKADLVYRPSGDTGQTLQVLLGNGDGTFSAPASVNLPANNYGRFALADVNNDGKLDLIAVSQFSPTSNLAVLLGNGDGSFQPAILSSLPSNGNGWPHFSAGMGIADFNGDGVVDIVIADQANSYLVLLIGDNHGHFLTRNSWFDGNTPSDIEVADFNRDGHMDFLADQGLGATADVFLGNGDGTFHSAATYSGPDHIGSVFLKDMNNDGILDMVATTLASSVQVFLGNPDGTFAASPAGTATGFAPGSRVLDVEDFNHDGTLDIAIVTNNGLGILLGQPNLTYEKLRDFPSGSSSFQVTKADFNSDGHVDFAFATPYGIALLFGNADGSFQSADAFDVPYAANSLVLGDLNGDGIPDLGVGVLGGVPQILQGRGDGSFILLPDQTGQVHSFQTYDGSVTAVGDFNGDHKLDLLNTGLAPYVEYGKGDGTFTFPTTPLLNGTTNIAGGAAYDLNGDGRTDVVLCDYQSVLILMAQADGTFISNSIYLPGLGVAAPVFGDFNNDGKIDIAVSAGGGTGVAILLGNGDGTFTAGPIYLSTGSQSSSIAVSDMDGDGNLDIIIPSNPTTPSFQILYGNGDGTFQSPVSYPTPHPVTIVAVSDLNLDNIPDVVSTDGDIITVTRGIGNRAFGVSRDFLAGASTASPLISDLNADGAPDLIFVNADVSGGNTVIVLLNLGPTRGSLSVTPTPSVYGQPIVFSAAFTPTVSAAESPLEQCPSQSITLLPSLPLYRTALRRSRTIKSFPLALIPLPLFGPVMPLSFPTIFPHRR